MDIRTPFVVLTCLFALSGCVQTRAYIAERERVDQEVKGIPAPVKPKTRQVFVLELIDKSPSAVSASSVTAGTPSYGPGTPSQGLTGTEGARESDLTLPPMGKGPALAETAAGGPVNVLPQEYKVEKDDTLQKISKKLYGTFSDWTKIYNANKDVIKDPNFLKPGITLKIPVVTTGTGPAEQ